MKKIAVISDIHGNIVALEAVVQDIQRRNVEAVINLGDHVSGPLWPQETLEYLKRQDWMHILGNHDRQLFEQHPTLHSQSDRHAYQSLTHDDLDWFRTLSFQLELQPEIVTFHGSPLNDTIYLLETIEHGRTRLATLREIKERLGSSPGSLMLCGHSHLPRVVEMPDNQLFVNPGSVGLPAYDDVQPEPHVMETGSPHARYALVEQIEESWRVELIAISYDFHVAAEQARKHGRPDWEQGLQTGYMTTRSPAG